MVVVYEGPVFSVEVGDHRFPDGREHTVAVVRHRPSVVIIPMPDDAHVILIRQYRPAVDRELWELPAGTLNAGEAADSAAARECEEEIALVPGRLERIRGLFPTPGFCDEELIFYRAWDLRTPPPDSPHKPDEDELIRPRIFTIADAKAMTASGDIIDLKTAYGLTLI
jgi:ADP-ribose pyrophosphatase